MAQRQPINSPTAAHSMRLRARSITNTSGKEEMPCTNKKKHPLKPIPWSQGFLAVLAETGSVERARKACNLSPGQVYRAREQRPEFAKKWEEALKQASDDIEQEIRRRGLEGVKEDVYFQGQVVGQKINYSDTLLMFYAKGLMPEKYRERFTADINSKVEMDLGSLILQARKRANDDALPPDSEKLPNPE